MRKILPCRYQWFSLYGKVLRKVKVLAQNLPMYYIGGALYMREGLGIL